jgi:hypothetical protein
LNVFYLKGQPFGAIRQNWLLTVSSHRIAIWMWALAVSICVLGDLATGTGAWAKKIHTQVPVPMTINPHNNGFRQAPYRKREVDTLTTSCSEVLGGNLKFG